MATYINISLEGLHQLQGRIDRRQLEGEDWIVVGAFVSKRIARTIARQARPALAPKRDLDNEIRDAYPSGMEQQHQIKRTLGKPENLDQVRRLIEDGEGMRRTRLADELCERFGFIDARGHKQQGTCLKALRDLERQGHVALPPVSPTRPVVHPSPRRLPEAVPAPQEVPETVGAVQGLQLVVVKTDVDMRTWNELMIRDHPRGAGPLVGRQLRYLIGSDHGWLGGLGFGAAALHLRDRDSWIGWDLEMRREQLHRVIGLARFLIRPQVHCRNLASRVLGLCARQLPNDFETSYGFRPWLVETFVDTARFSGTCFRAANWQWVGRTQGRGRQDRENRAPETVKDIYLLPLEPSVRVMMGLPANSGRSALTVDDGLDAEHWAQAEFGGAALGDARLAQRLAASAEAMAEKPGRAFCGVAKGDVAAVKGYYRLIDKPDDSAVTVENILQPHRERTVRRMKAEKTVLCIQDGTSLNFSGLDQTTGLGVIGTNQTGAKSRGLHLHSTFAVNPDGIPLGVLQAQFSVPQPTDDPRPPAEIPIEEKKTYSWILGLRDCTEIAREIAHTRLVSVMDREADFFELFDEHRRNPCVDLLVRAKHNRRIGEDDTLFDAVHRTSVCARLQIPVPRQSNRPKKSKQKARPKRQARTADVSLRYKHVELQPPSHLPDHEPIALWAIEAVEENPPNGVSPLRWILLTTREISSAEHCTECLRWYCLRWRIEDWHRVLKTGCRIEHLAHKTAVRLERAIAINLVIAWRIMLMTLLGREAPDLPAEVLLSDIEIEVLTAYAKTRKKKDQKSPARLGDAVRLVAQIGGYLGRKCDPPPGHQVMWQGLSQLLLMCAGYELGRGDPGL